jgi:iron(III) transport system substrate-binding protein
MKSHSISNLRRVLFALLGAALVVALIANLAPVRAQSSAVPKGVTPELKAAAAKEGRVVLWSALGGTYLDTVKREGEKALGITIETQRFTAFALAERASREFDGGINEIDVILLSTTDPMDDFRKKGMIAPYIPSSIDKYRSKDLYDREHYWHAIAITVSGIIYNTSLVKGDMVPRTWKDLTDPRYKDMQIMGSTNSGGGRTYSYWWWKWYGPEFFEALKRNNIQIAPSNQTAGPLVARGERAILPADVFNYVVIKNQGGPVDIAIPGDGVPAILGPIVLMAKAPHPAAAKVLIDWMLSPAAQALTADQGSLSPIEDESIRYPPALAALFKNVKVLVASSADINAWWNSVGKARLTAIFGGS